MLLPALSQAKRRAQGARCSGNLRQIGFAIAMYSDDQHNYPPGVVPGYTQWDLALSSYAGGNGVVNDPAGRSQVFQCPAASIANQSRQLNYSANPNICKDGQSSLPLRSDTVPRPVEALTAADSIQYQANGGSHAILWGVLNSHNKEITYNDGSPADAENPIQIGLDIDRALAVTDSQGADFRYRHARSQVEATFLDGHAMALAKGRIQEKLLYTDY